MRVHPQLTPLMWWLLEEESVPLVDADGCPAGEARADRARIDGRPVEVGLEQERGAMPCVRDSAKPCPLVDWPTRRMRQRASACSWPRSASRGSISQPERSSASSKVGRSRVTVAHRMSRSMSK